MWQALATGAAGHVALLPVAGRASRNHGQINSEKSIRLDPITLRFQLIRWSAIVFGIGLPLIGWLVASSLTDLDRDAAIGITMALVLVSVGVLKLVGNYLSDGFFRSYADKDNWDYLAMRFRIDKLPEEFRTAPSLTGVGQLDRDDVVFGMDIHVAQTGLYINTQPFGRLVVPWESVVMLRRRRLTTDEGPRDCATLTLDGPECWLTIPWSEHFDRFVPRSVGITAS